MAQLTRLILAAMIACAISANAEGVVISGAVLTDSFVDATSGGGGVPTFIRYDTAEEADSTSPRDVAVTIGAAVSANDTIVSICSVYDDSSSTPSVSVSDSVNGSHTEHGNQYALSPEDDTSNIEIGSVVSGSGTPTVTCTSDQTTGTAYLRLVVSVVRNLDTGGSRFLDATGGADSTSNPLDIGDITPGAGTDLFYIGGITHFSTTITSWTDPAGWTEIFSSPSSDVTMATAVSYLVSSGTQSQSWSMDPNSPLVAGIGAAFAPAP